MNTDKIKEIVKFIEDDAGIIIGINKKEELKRLIYEILLINNWDINDLKKLTDIQNFFNKNLQGANKFHTLKEILIQIRYPVASKSEKKLKIFLPPLRIPENKEKKFLSRDFYPERIYVQNSIKDFDLTKNILKKYTDVPYVFFDSLKHIKQDKAKFIGDMGKRDIYLIDESFDIIKPCPCTKNAISCNYYILNLGFGCPFDCSYCYLQHYMNIAGILLPVNLHSFFKKAEEILNKSENRFVRIGTGEFFDSLALDDITNYSIHLIDFFKNKNFLFEFKTKSNNIKNLLEVKNVPKNIIVSWSLNPQKLIDTEELYTSSLDERLCAAKELIEKGYKVGFHFDPVIYYKDWENDYEKVIKKMFEYAGNNIVWISIGTLRFYRGLKTIVEKRFPEDLYFYGEFLLDPLDNKMRYPYIIRKYIYRKMLDMIKNYGPKTPVYLCMESQKMHKEIFSSSVSTEEIEKEFLSKIS